MLRVTDHEQSMIHSVRAMIEIHTGSYRNTEWRPPNRKGGVDKSFLEEVTFELKHKRRKRVN